VEAVKPSNFRLRYEFFQDKGLKATVAYIQGLTNLLGHVPRNFEEFAMETAGLSKG
jgi:hypothetical protein